MARMTWANDLMCHHLLFITRATKVCLVGMCYKSNTLLEFIGHAGPSLDIPIVEGPRENKGVETQVLRAQPRGVGPKGVGSKEGHKAPTKCTAKNWLPSSWFCCRLACCPRKMARWLRVRTHPREVLCAHIQGILGDFSHVWGVHYWSTLIWFKF